MWTANYRDEIRYIDADPHTYRAYRRSARVGTISHKFKFTLRRTNIRY